MRQETRIGGVARDFPSTRWSSVLEAREHPERRRAVLEELLAARWKPLYFFVRRKGYSVEGAKDVVQGFCAHLLEQALLDKLERGKGRLRAYLLTALGNYLANLHAMQTAHKRGGGVPPLSLDLDLAEHDLASSAESPAAAFEREWALGIMERALDRLRVEFELGRRRGPVELALRFFQPAEAPSYADAAAAADMSLVQFKAFLHRTRERYRELVREEVAATLPDDGDARDELGELLLALRS